MADPIGTDPPRHIDISINIAALLDIALKAVAIVALGKYIGWWG